MPGPGGVEAGRASIRVLPDTSAFASSLEKYLDRMERRLKIEIPTQVNASTLERDIKAVAKTVAAASKVSVPVDLKNEEQVKREFDRLVRDISGKTAEITITASRSTGRVLDDFGRISNAIGATALKVGGLVGALGGVGLAAAGAASAVAVLSGAVAIVPSAGLAAAAAMATLTIGMSGFDEVLKNLDDPTKFAKALEALSPAAQAAAIAIRDLKPAADEARKAIQDRLFAGIAAQIQSLGTTYIPILTNGFGRIADSINLAARDIADFLNSAQAIGDITNIFDRLDTTFGSLAGSARPLVQAFLDIATVGSEFLPGLAEGFTSSAEAFAAFIRQSRETGELKNFIANALAGVKQLVQIVSNLGAILSQIFAQAREVGGGFLGILVQITDQLREFALSAEAATLLRNIFQGIASVVQGILPVLREMGTVASQVISPAFAALGRDVGEALRSLVPAVRPFGEALAALGPVIGIAAKAVAGLVVALVQALSPVIVTLAPSVGRLVEVLGGGLAGVLNALAPVIAGVAERLAPLIDLFANFLASALESITPLLATIVETGFNVLLAVLEAIAPVLPTVAEAIAQIAGVIGGALRDAAPVLVDIATALGELIVAAIQNILPIMPQLIQAFLDLIAAVLPLLPPLLDLATTILPLVVNTAVLEFIIELARIITELLNAITPLVTVLVESLIPALKVLVEVVSSVFEAIGNIISGVLSAILGNIKVFIGVLTGDWRLAWDGIKDIVSGAWNIIKGVVELGITSILGPFRGLVGSLGDAARSAWNAARDAFSSGIDSVVGLVRDLPGKVAGALGNLGSTLYNAGKSLIQGFVNGISSMISSATSAASRLIGAVRNFFPFSPAKRGPLSGRGYTSYSGIALARDFAKSIESGVPLVVSATDRLLGAARLSTVGGFGSSGSGLYARREVAVTQNIYPQPLQSEESIGMAASRELALALRTG